MNQSTITPADEAEAASDRWLRKNGESAVLAAVALCKETGMRLDEIAFIALTGSERGPMNFNSREEVAKAVERLNRECGEAVRTMPAPTDVMIGAFFNGKRVIVKQVSVILTTAPAGAA